MHSEINYFLFSFEQGVEAHTSKPSIWRQRQEYQEFKVIRGYIKTERSEEELVFEWPYSVEGLDEWVCTNWDLTEELESTQCSTEQGEEGEGQFLKQVRWAQLAAVLANKQ